MTNPPIRQTIMQSQSMANMPDGDEIALCVRNVGGTIDFMHNEPMASIFGEMTTGEREDYVSIIFQYGISTRDVRIVTSGSGVTSHNNQMADAAVNSGLGIANLESKDVNRYRAGHEMLSQFTGVFKGAAAGVRQFLGPHNGQDAACFGTNSGQFGAWLIESNSETFTPINSFNVDVASWMDIEMMNIYMVSYGYLGIAPIRYSAFNPIERKWSLLHEINLVNSRDTPHLGNPTLPIGAVSERVTTQSNSPASVRTASWRSGCIGGGDESNSANRWFAYTALDKTIVANSSNNVFSIRVSSSFGGIGNHVIAEVGVVTFDNATNKTVAWYGTKNATITSGSAWTPVQSGSSTVDVSEGGYITGGTRGPATVTRSGADRRTDVRGTGIIIYPGETFTFEAIASGGVSGTVSLSARWIERF